MLPTGVAGVMVSIVALQAVDPSSIPGDALLFSCAFALLFKVLVKTLSSLISVGGRRVIHFATGTEV